jgi:N-acetylgalactosamine-N,N'-diacetylbacillosaminyl-diphospho-undecaprenol 4-alpha-N-acetylgalactosaminyltransferase
VADDLIQNYGMPADKVITIYNPIDYHAIERESQERPSVTIPPNYIVAVGRLVPNKNFAMLIRSFAAIDTEGSLVILGEGPEHSRLKALAIELGIEDRVYMPGFIANPHAIVGRAKFYVSSSNAEGFPNAMIEAMCIGKAVVATDCDSGPSEILSSSPIAPKVVGLTLADHGILVPINDERAMSAAFKIMADPDIRAQLSTAARLRARHFDLDHAFAQYKEVIDKCLSDVRSGKSEPQP